MAQPGDVGDDPLEERHEVRVDEHDPVVGVVHDEGQLVVGEAHVEGVEHPPRAGDGEVGLEMVVAVPGQGGHPLPGADPQPVEGPHELLAPDREITEVVAVQVP